MDESLTQRHRVEDDSLRVVNSFSLILLSEESVTTNYVPAVAVIRRSQALPGFIGRKESVGGFLSPVSKTSA